MEISDNVFMTLVKDIERLTVRVEELEKRKTAPSNRPRVITKSPREEAIAISENQAKLKDSKASDKRTAEHQYPSNRQGRLDKLEEKHGNLRR